jgi:hypothetical protein
MPMLPVPTTATRTEPTGGGDAGDKEVSNSAGEFSAFTLPIILLNNCTTTTLTHDFGLLRIFQKPPNSLCNFFRF